MIYIIDTYAWVEYFKGSERGIKVKKMFENNTHKFITMECCIAELAGFCLRNCIDFDKMYHVVKINSLILPVLINHWIDAAKIRFEARKKIKDFGLIDSIMITKQNELKCMILSGDKHLKEMENVVFI